MSFTRFFPRPGIGILAIAAALLAAGGLQSLRAQDTAAEILRTASERYEARVADVEEYTVVQEVNGVERVVHYERREVDGRTTFVPVDPIATGLVTGRFEEALGARAPEQGVLASVRDAMLGAVAEAGMAEVETALRESGQDELAAFVAPLLASARSEDGSISFEALQDSERLKEALIEGAKRAGMEFAIDQISQLALGEFAPVVDVLRGKAEPGEILGMLGETLTSGDLGALAGAMGGPGRQGGPAGGPDAGGILAGAAQAGLGALAQHGARALTGAATDAIAEGMAGGGMNPQLDVYGMMGDLEEVAVLEGTERVDGREAWVLEIDDLSRLDVEADQLRDARLTMSWDTELYVPLRVVMTGEVEGPDGWMPITVRSRFEAYEEAEGMLLPRRTTTAIEGMDAAMSEEEREEMRRGMAQMEEQMAQMEEELANLPPEQRAMVEEMMKSRMPQMEAMMGGESMEIVTVVKEVRVNEGRPEG